MIAELISRIVIAHELTPDDARLRDEFFTVFDPEWAFLRKYYSEFRSLPNVATFTGQFPEFPFEQTERTAPWLLDEITQTHIDGLLDMRMLEFGDRKAVNPKEALLYLEKITSELRPLVSSSLGAAISLLRDDASEERDLIERNSRVRMSGITSGFTLLDAVTFGTQPGELEIWFGRPGEGKTLMLLHSTLASCRAGYNVSFVSPEMNRTEICARLYAMMLHVSATGVQFGNLTAFELQQFLADRRELFSSMNDWGKLLFREAQGHSGRFTTADLSKVIAVDKPALVVVDGLMLIDPMSSERDPRKRIVALMQELKTLAVSTSTPIRLAHQANRTSDVSAGSQRKGLSLNDMLPDLTHLAESASVEHYANRVIAIKRIGRRMYLALRKNRSAENGRFMSFDYDIDRASMTDMKQEHSDTLLERVRHDHGPESSEELAPVPF